MLTPVSLILITFVLISLFAVFYIHTQGVLALIVQSATRRLYVKKQIKDMK